MSTSIVRPTFSAMSARLTSCCAAMKRCQRSSFTSSGTAPVRSLAAAPSTGSYLKQPARLIRASLIHCRSRSKSRSVSPGNPTMKVERMARSGTACRQRADALRGLLLMRRTPHRLQHGWRRVLERNVEIRQHQAVRHQRQYVVHVRIRIDVVQPHPGAEAAESLASDRKTCALSGAPFHMLSAYLMSRP